MEGWEDGGGQNHNSFLTPSFISEQKPRTQSQVFRILCHHLYIPTDRCYPRLPLRPGQFNFYSHLSPGVANKWGFLLYPVTHEPVEDG
jgi:hypothetical protein